MALYTRSHHPRVRPRFVGTLETPPAAPGELLVGHAQPALVATLTHAPLRRVAVPSVASAPPAGLTPTTIRAVHDRRQTLQRAIAASMRKVPLTVTPAPPTPPAPGLRPLPAAVRPRDVRPLQRSMPLKALPPVPAAAPPVARWFGKPSRPSFYTPPAVLPRRLGAMVHVLAPTGPGAAVSVVTVTPWSEAVEFLPGDEWIVTISGPSADAPKVRITMKFRTRTYSDG